MLAQAFDCFVLWIVTVICGFLDDIALKEMKINLNSEEVLLPSFTHTHSCASRRLTGLGVSQERSFPLLLGSEVQWQ